MNCINCHCITLNPKFCSRSCSASYNNKKNPKRKLNRICNRNNCNLIVYTYRHKFCEKHFLEHKELKHKTKTIGEYRNSLSLRDKHPSWVHSHIRSFCRKWNKNLINLPCHKCGYTLHVELCHIKPLSSFADDALLEEINSSKNVVQLCRNCHWEMDNNIWNLQTPALSS